MKTSFKYFVVLLSTFVFAGQAFAQDYYEEYESNRDAEGRVVRGSYLTNEWYDNWSFILAGGAQTMISNADLRTARITPAVELAAIKWFTPTIAFRFGYQGLNLQENYEPHWGQHYPLKYDADKGVVYYNQAYMHVDLMLSVSNFFWGYNRSRFANFVPYVHAGYERMSHPDYSYFTNVYRDREVAAGLGLFSSFRIANSVSATLDVRNSYISGRFHEANKGGVVSQWMVSAGLSYTIYKWYWTRSKGIIVARDNAIAAAEEAEVVAKQIAEERQELSNKVIELNEQVTDLNEQVDVLYKEVEEAKVEAEKVARENPDDELMARIAKSDMVLYYDINSDKLAPTEVMRLDAYIRATIARNPWHVFYITGSADEGTGTESINTRLSKSRAESIKKALIRKYGVPESQVVIKATVISHEHEDGRFDRCVFFENE